MQLFRKLSVWSFSIIFLGISIISFQANVCTPDPLPLQTSPMTIEQALRLIEALNSDLAVEYQSMCKCGSVYYSIRDKNGFVADVEAGNDEFQGNRIYNFFMVLNNLAPHERKALKSSSAVLKQDIKEMENEFGIKFYSPNAQPLAERFPGGKKDLLYLTMEKVYYREDFPDVINYSSGKVMSKTFLVNSSEFLPGTNESAINYRQGELRQEFLKNRDLFEACKRQAIDNRDIPYPSKIHNDWDDKVKAFERAEKEPLEIAKKSSCEIL